MILVWLIEDEPTCGDFNDYVKSWQSGYYSDIAVSNHVWAYVNDEMQKFYLEVIRGEVSENDYIPYTLVLRLPTTQVAYISIDGRA